MKSFRHHPLVCVLIPLLALCGSLRADVKPSALFSEGAVLQQGVPIPVWGTARAGEKVTVRLNEQEATTTAGKNGKWMVHLPPREAGGPFVMTISGNNTVTIGDVLVGEVWVAVGQSNMDFGLGGASNADTEIPLAKYPKLRFFSVGHKNAVIPQTELEGHWVGCSPEIAGRFSAVSYFFGRDIHKMRSVPVGMIVSSWCGTPGQAWSSLDALQKDPQLATYADVAQRLASGYPHAARMYPQRFAKYWEAFTKWNDRYGKPYDNNLKAWVSESEKAKTEGAPVPPQPIPGAYPPLPPESLDADESMPKTPAVLFNGMIAPLIPYAIKGMIWYQGEGNAHKALEYQTLFPCLIADYREKWQRGNFPFLFVQIAPCDRMVPEIREAQFLTLGKSPNTAMAVITDVGEAKNIHPKKKEPVGVRLALAARALAYGESIEYSGPLFQSMKIEGNRAILTFGHTGNGMVAKEGEIKGFIIAGADGKFVSAKAGIVGDTIVVSSPEVATPVAVRYGWDNVPDVNLYNKEGLPASPFRTDCPLPEPIAKEQRNL
jgi:sialate O-acetylesterase